MILNLKKTTEIQQAIEAILAISSIPDEVKKQAIAKIDTAEVTAETLVDSINNHPTETRTNITMSTRKSQSFEILVAEISEEIDLKLTDLIESGYLEELDSANPAFRVFNNLSLEQESPKHYSSIDAFLSAECKPEVEEVETEEEIQEEAEIEEIEEPSESISISPFRQL
jgi:hypothetical protein